MFSKKKDPKYSMINAGEPTKSHALRSELRRLMWLSLAVCLFLSLASYSPVDPSWSTWSSRPFFRNWMGRTGSITADLLFQLFGLTAFVLAFAPAYFALRKEVSDHSRADRWGSALLLLSLSSLLQSLIPEPWMPWHLVNPGGVVGSLAIRALSYASGRVGARLLSFVLLAASAIVVFRWKLFTFLIDLLKKSPKLLMSALTFVRESGIARIKVRLEMLRSRSSHATPPGLTNLSLTSLPVAPLADPLAEIIAPTKKTTPEENLSGSDLIAYPAAPTVIHKVPKTRVHRGVSRDFQLPGMNLLSGKAEAKTKTIDKSWYLEKANILVQKLRDFGVDGEVVHISPGPVITVYEFKPASGVKIKEISNLSDDLTLALSALSVRIVAPIPGKPVVGIEIPSPHREMVFFKDLLQETPFFKGELKIPIILGRLASGEPVAADLASMPHLLIAGSTGTGKSVFINTLIFSLVYRFSPEQLKLIMVDPKMVELSHYEGIPHLLLPVVVDSKKAVLALRWTVDEMERRYTLMHQTGVRHIDSYNEKLTESQKEHPDAEHQTLPYIVVIIDEYADLMAVVPKEVELSIARLAQKARASGIHLVLATQRPSTDVVTGTIKANFPTRISFRVASAVDSKTILDRTGAERLLGHGDLLVHSAGFASLRRMQGPYLSDADINTVVEYLKAQGEPEYDERILTMAEEGEASSQLMFEEEGEGKLYDTAVRLVTEKGEASISLIQRHLKIGYNRAASLIEQMEREGVVGPSAGPAKRRSVLVNSL
jgi:DNA segregation ATPase FtsK/SpoIIIE, S-DNA-T family